MYTPYFAATFELYALTPLLRSAHARTAALIGPGEGLPRLHALGVAEENEYVADILSGRIDDDGCAVRLLCGTYRTPRARLHRHA